MTSRVRDRSSTREERSKVASSRVKDRLHDGEDRALNHKGNRYHFGMTRSEEREEASKNGQYYGTEDGNVNADLLYKKSKEHFGAWDIKDIVQDESWRSRRQTDRLTNGRSRDVCVEDVDEVRTEGSGVDPRVSSTHRLRRKERWESSDGSKISAAKSGRAGRGDDRQLSKEMENLSVVDGRSGEDRARSIRTMIERFKPREEESKSKLRPREWNSSEREGYGSRKDGGRGELRIDRVTDINDRDRGRIQKDDPAEERGPSRGSKLGGAERYEEVGRSGSVDRRTEKFNDPAAEKRRSRETAFEGDVSRRREGNSRRRSYVYDGNPDDFEVRIQRYERGVADAGRPTVDSSKRKESGVDSGRRDSFKDPHDRQVTRKSSFNKCCDARRNSHHSRDRESSKDRENEPCSGKSSFKSQERKHSGRENPEQRVSSKDYEGGGRKNCSKESDSDYGRILSRNRDDEEERKRSFKGHNSDTGISRIAFKDADSSRVHSSKDREADVGSRVSFDVGRKNSLKEKSVEFGGISYRDHDDEADPRSSAGRDNEAARRRRSPNGRYVEFGGVSFQSEADDSEASPSNEPSRGWPKERGDTSRRRGGSSRGKNREEGDSDKRSDRHSRPLTPPKREGGEEFDSKAWHESNRIFAANYIRENSRYRANPEGRSEIDRDPSPELGIQQPRDNRIHRSCLEDGSNELEEGSKARRKSEENPRAYALGRNGEHPGRDGDSSRYASSTHEGRNGATIIRIRSSPETGVERRRRRRLAQDAYAGRRRRCEDPGEDEEDSEEEDEEGDDRRGGSRDDGFIPGRGVSTPSRRVWNYREGVWHFHESIAFDRSFMVQKREAIFINRWRR